MKRKNPESVFFLLLSLFWFLYLAFRAWKVPPVYDEVTTFFLYVLPGDFLPFSSYPSANNHWLHSAGTWLFYQMLPPSLFSLRILSLLSFPLYALGVFYLGQKIQRKRGRWTLWILMMGLHFPLEFFAYSRGYAWGLASMVWAIFYAHRMSDNASRHNTIGFFLSLVIGVSFNLNLMPLLGLGLVWIYYTHPKESIANSIWIAALGVLPLLFYTRYSWYLRESGELYYGTEGFWTHSTVPTLSEALFSSASSGSYWLFTVWILVALVALVLGLRSLHWKKIPFELFGFLGSFVGLTALYLIWGIHLPQDRTALFILFLLIVSVAFSIDRMKAGFLSTLLSLNTSLLAVTFFFQWSLEASSFTLWKKEQVPVRFLEEIVKDPMESPSVSAHYLTAHSYALQRHLYHPDSPPIIGLKDTAFSTDFVIREMGRTSRFFRRNYQLVADDPATGKTLWKLRAHQWQPIENGQLNLGNTSGEYMNIYTWERDSADDGWHKLIVNYQWKTSSKQPLYFSVQKLSDTGRQTFESIPIFPTKGNLQQSTLAYPFLLDSSHAKVNFFFHNPGGLTLDQTEYDWVVFNHPK